MSAEKVQALQQMKANECVVIGRIEGSSKSADQVYTRVVMPSPDQFTAPGFVEITSKQRLGAIGDDCRVLCRLGGYRKSGKDRDGEATTWVNMRLTAVE